MHSNGDMASLSVLAYDTINRYSAQRGVAWSEKGVSVTLTKWQFDGNQVGTEVEAAPLSEDEVVAVAESIHKDGPVLAWFLGLASLYPTERSIEN